MNKNLFLRLTALLLCVMMLLALFACDSGKKPDEGTVGVTDSETEKATDNVSDAETNKVTDLETENKTDAPTEQKTDAKTEDDSEKNTEKGSEESNATESVGESETNVTESASESGSASESASESKSESASASESESKSESGSESGSESVATEEKLTEKPKETESSEPETDPPASDKKCEKDACTLRLSNVTASTYVCTVCGAQYSYEISEKINFYSAPGQALNNWGAGYPGNGDADWEHKIMMEDGRIFERITLGDGASWKFDNGTSEKIRRFPATSTISGGSGRYLVLRVRGSELGNSMKLILNSDISTQGSNTDLKANAANSISRQTPFEEGVWNTYVIDLKTAALPLYSAENKTVQKIAVGFDMAGFVASENSYFDFEYVAICDDWSEIDEIVKEETVMLSGWRNNEPWRTVSSEDGGLAIDTEGEDADRLIYQKTGNELCVYIRSPYAESYTMYKFAYMKNDSTAYEGWMIYSVAICDTSLNILYYASREKATDLEGALQEYNTSYMSVNGTNLAGDFIGGFHGDEKYRTVKIAVDGVELNMSKSYSFASCKSVVATVESDVYRWDSTERVFDRTKTISWSEAGMEITNSYKTVAPITIYRPAVGMLVVYRDDSGYKDSVTKHWDNISNKWIDIVWPDKPSSYYHQNNMTYAKLDGDNICATLEIKDYGVNGVKTDSIGWFNYDSWSVGNQRAKIYIDIFRLKELKVDDVMHCTAVHTVFAKADKADIWPDESESEAPGNTETEAPGNTETEAPGTDSTEPSECEHSCSVVSENNDWVIKCSKCDYKYEYGLDRSVALKSWYSNNVGEWSNINGRINYKFGFFEPDQPDYCRLTQIAKTDTQMIFNSDAKNERYVVIRYRIGENGLGQTNMQFYAPSNLSGTQTYANAGFCVAVSEDNEWHTVVIDLAERVAEGGYNKNSDGVYDLSTMYIRIFGDKQQEAVGSETAYVDIAYICIFDDFEDISSLVIGDSYEWSVSDTENELRDSKTHQPIIK